MFTGSDKQNSLIEQSTMLYVTALLESFANLGPVSHMTIINLTQFLLINNNTQVARGNFYVYT